MVRRIPIRTDTSSKVTVYIGDMESPKDRVSTICASYIGRNDMLVEDCQSFNYEETKKIIEALSTIDD